MTTARLLFHQCRKAGIALAVEGAGIAFDAPPGVAVPVDDLRGCKAELLAVLQGAYLSAAAALVKRVADPDEREALAYRFDERAGICESDGNMSRGEAERQAYIELARDVEAEEHDTCNSTSKRYNDGDEQEDIPDRPAPADHRRVRHVPLRRLQADGDGPRQHEPVHGRPGLAVEPVGRPHQRTAGPAARGEPADPEEQRTVSNGNDRS